MLIGLQEQLHHGIAVAAVLLAIAFTSAAKMPPRTASGQGAIAPTRLASNKSCFHAVTNNRNTRFLRVLNHKSTISL